MSSIREMYNRVVDLNKFKDNFLIEVVNEEALSILQDRLEDGKQANGESFPEYSPVTIGIKRATGGFVSSSGNIALKDTGSFYNSMKLDKQSNYAEIVSTSSLFPKLVQRYGDKILDVSKEENNEIFERKREEYIDNISKFLFK